jgi:hypothetical protein
MPNRFEPARLRCMCKSPGAAATSNHATGVCQQLPFSTAPSSPFRGAPPRRRGPGPAQLAAGAGLRTADAAGRGRRRCAGRPARAARPRAGVHHITRSRPPSPAPPPLLPPPLPLLHTSCNFTHLSLQRPRKIQGWLRVFHAVLLRSTRGTSLAMLVRTGHPLSLIFHVWLLRRRRASSSSFQRWRALSRASHDSAVPLAVAVNVCTASWWQAFSRGTWSTARHPLLNPVLPCYQRPSSPQRLVTHDGPQDIYKWQHTQRTLSFRQASQNYQTLVRCLFKHNERYSEAQRHITYMTASKAPN